MVAVQVPSKRRSRSEFETTLIELNAIAAPAMIGLSTPVAASGIASVLSPVIIATCRPRAFSAVIVCEVHGLFRTPAASPKPHYITTSARRPRAVNARSLRIRACTLLS